MAGAAEVLGKLADLDGVTRAALVPNARGRGGDAVAAGADELTATLSVSEEYSTRNVRMTVGESLAALDRIVAIGAAEYDADGRRHLVLLRLALRGRDRARATSPRSSSAVPGRRGRDRITLADTTGMATPRGIDAVLDAVGTDVGLHLHETRGTALVCAYAGLVRGVRRFDCSVGGLGGSPFAEGAAGNLATEGLVNLLDDLGVVSGH